MEHRQATRIQTSVLNSLERKLLVWLAARQPKWVNSDMMTFLGSFGAFLIGLGYALTSFNVNFLWLSTFGLLVNWYGDSLDGTLARYRNKQRPVYGYYLDHTMDVVNEAMMFFGAGMAPFFDMRLTLSAFVLYLLLTINVSMNAHLRGEFKLTYFKLGPTEFRLIIIIANTLLIAIPVLTAIRHSYTLLGHSITMRILDYVAVVIITIMSLIYIVTTISDARKYAVIDPPKKPQKTTDE